MQVYKAMRRHVQDCAVKILRNVNEAELINFQREVYIMQQCSFDRNIVQFYGAQHACQCAWLYLTWGA